ncbi:hypothetical protein GDO81_020942 [Engystomops pustulosus]|uniref:Uncharacterized protein n=1 Tax=Engystomops pustulosus TaxID=76066 RepID=A0AAV6YWA4_ENGPU|nr:hypothetical protein GDO81_020942 [Engystomops pustulosus]
MFPHPHPSPFSLRFAISSSPSSLFLCLFLSPPPKFTSYFEGKRQSPEKDTDSAVEVSIHNRLQTSQHSAPQGPENGAPGSTAPNGQREALQAAPYDRLLQCQQIVKVIVLDTPGRALPAIDQTVTRYLSGSCSSTPLRSVGGAVHQPPLPPPPPPYNHPHQYCPPGVLLRERRYSSGSRSLV